MGKKLIAWIGFGLIFALFGGVFYLVKHTDLLQDRGILSAKHNESIRPLSEAEREGKEFCECMKINGSPTHFEYASKVCEGEMIQKYSFLRLWFVDIQTPFLKNRMSNEKYFFEKENIQQFRQYLKEHCNLETAGRREKLGKNCSCEKGEDPDDYLYKICMYLKNEEFGPENPCNYKISKIEESGNYIIVQLNCCYMGDYAIFNKETKELIEFHVSDI